MYKALLLFNVQGIRSDIELNERRARELRGLLADKDEHHHHHHYVRHDDNGTEHLLGAEQV